MFWGLCAPRNQGSWPGGAKCPARLSLLLRRVLHPAPRRAGQRMSGRLVRLAGPKRTAKQASFPFAGTYPRTRSSAACSVSPGPNASVTTAAPGGSTGRSRSSSSSAVAEEQLP